MIINKDIIARELQGETVLLNMQNGDYFTLNGMGTEIYNLIRSGKGAGEIVELLLEKYDVGHDRLSADVSSLIDELKDKKILID